MSQNPSSRELTFRRIAFWVAILLMLGGLVNFMNWERTGTGDPFLGWGAVIGLFILVGHILTRVEIPQK